ncbi:MAG TPA: folylpolyglutamate synthase/dihydrofolate synthase family protein [Bryobacteraceae bacterium]|nr:folylpolyglutamate synthase/dihydrofolate synthase family protein [Bryobacteraceae bacterium]
MITYPDSVRFLYSLGNELKAVKFGLDTIRAVLRELGHPERAVRAVHVAGTNGKGSTCAMIASGLREAGFSTGLFTSPHLVEPVERIQIDGVPVTAEEFSRAFDIVHQAAEKLLAAGSLETHPTYFETVTAMAFILFRERDVDRVVLEVGLGGRLDATNVVTPELCVITPIDYDHESWLGATIDLIAAEKAGIIKPQIPVVIARQREDAEQVLLRRAAELGAPVIPAPEAERFEAGPRGSIVHWRGMALQCPLAGVHQVGNTITAAEALRALDVADNAILRGIARTRWPGRLEAVSTSPDIILDGAHNPAGARALAGYITRFYNHRKVWLIYGTMRDKSVAEIADTLFPLAQELILTAADSARSLAPESLLPLTAHPRATIAPNLAAALELARAGASPDDAIFISGSLFLVGEARALLVR